MKALLRDFIALLYPELCCHCNRLLYHHEDHLCIYCKGEMPFTLFESHSPNLMEQRLWGRFPVQRAIALLYFKKRSVTKTLLHQLKYKGEQDIGIFLGEILGERVKRAFSEESIPDTLMVVPLHKKKLAKRGYNQCDSLAEGICKKLKINWDKDNLVRIEYNESQTRKSMFERWKNVETIFNIQFPKRIEGKHVLLIDDVMTTGSTLEACARELLLIPGVKVSIATAAFSYN